MHMFTFLFGLPLEINKSNKSATEAKPTTANSALNLVNYAFFAFVGEFAILNSLFLDLQVLIIKVGLNFVP